MKRTHSLRIGNAGGYWGDDHSALKRQVEGGHLDYITIDFLAEITMSILKKQHAQDPQQGYAYDFITMLSEVLPEILRKKTKIITNAGGINPQACARAIKALADKLGVKAKIAVVYGDDIVARIPEFLQHGQALTNMETGQGLHQIKDKVVAANVYFGALPVVRALETWEPDIIITGRVTDTGITLAPMIHEFGWDLKDWDKLAAGIVAGHLIECGAQVTGGNYTDWKSVKNYNNIGYPIIEVNPDSSFVLTKHPNTGGCVNLNTIREQLFYEMGNPRAYITPDVVADFSTIKVRQDGEDRVFVSGVKGYEPTSSYKVSMAYENGSKCIGSVVISGPHAVQKAKKFSEIFWERCPPAQFEETITEFLGWNACHRSLAHSDEGAEILLRLGAKSNDGKRLKFFSKLIPSLILSGPPGVTMISGAPKPQSIISYWPALLDKNQVNPWIALCTDGELEQAKEIKEYLTGTPQLPKETPQSSEVVTLSVEEAINSKSTSGKVQLSEICLARSGDKGDMANIGLLARSPKAFAFIKEHITAQVVKNLFQELCLGRVDRYVLEGLQGLNFLLDHSLGGGGSSTLRTDAQGKTFAQALLRQYFIIPADVIKEVQALRG